MFRPHKHIYYITFEEQKIFSKRGRGDDYSRKIYTPDVYLGRGGMYEDLFLNQQNLEYLKIWRKYFIIYYFIAYFLIKKKSRTFKGVSTNLKCSELYYPFFDNR